jgi:hypothetical protein
MSFLKLIVVLGIMVTISACSTERESDPSRTATEQLLISEAADRSADQLNLNIPPGSKVFVDASNIDGVDSKYAIATMRERILKLGGDLVADRGSADAVVEIRSGALSIDENTSLVGIPALPIPIPLAGNITIPEIALFKKAEREGVAKFGGIAYEAKNGKLIGISEPQFGYAHEGQHVFLMFFSWETRDFSADKKQLVPVDRSDLPGTPSIAALSP